LSRRSKSPAFRFRWNDPFALLCGAFLAAWLLVIAYPLLFVLSYSLRRADELSLDRFAGVVPVHFRWSNYPDAFDLMSTALIPIPRIVLNSAIVTVGAIVLALFVSILAAFAFSTIPFRGRRFVFYLLLMALIVPIPVMLIPEFLTVKEYGLIGSRLSLILPYAAFGLPLPILVLTTFFREVPAEILEAATLDGASRLRTLWSVMLPLSRPAIATSVIFLTLMYWNEFPLALVMVQDSSLTTVPLAIAGVQSRGTAAWELIAAAIVVMSIPVVALFVAFQRQFIEGLAQGSVKG
jgi:raffinose/stachyose/melibiose transport system permease protein